MIVRWLEDAVDDLKALRAYIAHDNLQAANNVAKRILEAIDCLSKQPGIGRPGRVLHTRELVIAGLPYIIPYRVRNNTIDILRVLHGAMQWPEELGEH